MAFKNLIPYPRSAHKLLIEWRDTAPVLIVHAERIPHYKIDVLGIELILKIILPHRIERQTLAVEPLVLVDEGMPHSGIGYHILIITDET